MSEETLMQCPNCRVQLGVTVKAIVPPGEPPPDQPAKVLGASQTRVVDVGSQSGPYEGTGRDTQIFDMPDKAIGSLAPATSVNKRTAVGAVVAFKINLVPGSFRAGLGEYGDAGNFLSDLALSRTPFEIEGAPARDPKNITGITIGADQDQVFAAGEWFLNVRVNAAGAEGRDTQGWTLSFYNAP